MQRVFKTIPVLSALLAAAVLGGCGGSGHPGLTGSVSTAPGANTSGTKVALAPVSERAPDFTLTTVRGKTVHLDELAPANKAVLVDFWQLQ